jgi:small-conductance mechanosensitive channel
MPDTIGDFFANLWSDIGDAVVSFAPDLLAALAILVVGWLVARLSRLLVEQVLRRAGLDRMAERTGITQTLAQADIQASISKLAGQLVFWIIFLFFLASAVETLGLAAASEPLRALIVYLPRILAAGVVLLGGLLFASLVAKTVTAMAVSAGLEFGKTLGQVGQVLVVSLALVLAIDQLGFNAAVLDGLLTNTLTAILAGGALAFALGGRDVAANVLAAHYAKELFELGETISLDGIEGTLESIGPVKSTIATHDGLVSVPNSDLTTRTVVARTVKQ